MSIGDCDFDRWRQKLCELETNEAGRDLDYGDIQSLGRDEVGRQASCVQPL